MTLADRFWAKVRRPQRGCWLWTGCIGDLGYGRCKVDGRLRAAHRVAYELEHGPIPPNTLIRQKCGSRRCCRPEHLTAVTVRRLSREAVAAIRVSLLGHKRLAALHCVSRGRIQQIRRYASITYSK